MRKMKLDIHQLTVESLSINDGDTDVRGTVPGNAATERFCTVGPTCYTCDTCQVSCVWTCVNGQQIC